MNSRIFSYDMAKKTCTEVSVFPPPAKFTYMEPERRELSCRVSWKIRKYSGFVKFNRPGHHVTKHSEVKQKGLSLTGVN